jgi:hypothetical protein
MSRDNSATIPWMRARKLDGRAGPGSEILQVGLSRLPNRLWRWANEVQEKEWWEEDFKDGWARHEFGRRWEKGCSRCWTLTVWENPPRLFQVGAEVVEVAHRTRGAVACKDSEKTPNQTLAQRINDRSHQSAS